MVKNIHKLKNEEHLKFWLIRTTVNCCKTKNARLRFTAASSTDTEADSSDETLSCDIRLMIEKLPQKYRDVVILCCLEGYTADEAARILKKPSGTIKSQLFRARKLLKEKLED